MALNRTENEAAWLMGASERLKVDSIQNWTPGPGEIRVRNEVISLNPIEAKIQKSAPPRTVVRIQRCNSAVLTCSTGSTCSSFSFQLF